MTNTDLSKPLAAPDLPDGTEETVINIPSRPEFACASRAAAAGEGKPGVPLPALFNDWQLS